MSDYEAFLRAKQRSTVETGRVIEPDAVHPSLFGFQRALVGWAVRKGRAAMWADTGLGKTRMQLEWARLSGNRALILAPLAVAQQTVREAADLGIEVGYARHQDDVGTRIVITNYERLDRFDPASFGAVVLDESSILKAFDGATKRALVAAFRSAPWRLACTATPAPNDVVELTNHAEFLGLMSRAEMLAAYFVHDDNGWRLKGHAAEPMYRWMSSWASAVRRPSDLGFSDDGFVLPPLRIYAETVEVEITPPGQLFATDLGGVSGRAAVRRATLTARVARAAELAAAPGQWIVWCGLNDEARSAAASIDGAINVEGSWAPEAKAEALMAFQAGEVRVLVTKPSIAGFGMNFQQCSRMVFVGLNDSYEAYYQAIRRCFRFGQQRPVDVHIVVSEIERQIVENVRRKEAEAAMLTDTLVRHMAVAA